LDLSGASQNDVSSWSVLATALQPLNSLTHLSLQSCQLSSAAMSILLPSLTFCRNLLTLDLSNNDKMTSKGIQCLSTRLHCFPLLKNLRLSCFDPAGDAACALAQALTSIRCLSELDLTGFLTCDEGANQLQAVAYSIGNVAFSCPKRIDSCTVQTVPSRSRRMPSLHVE
jgi:Leucine Rich repeat